MPSVARRSRPSRTYVGRVVYNRTPHLFSMRDLLRVADHVFVRLGEDPSVLASVVYDLSIRMLQIILFRIGLPGLAKIVYLFLIRIVDWGVQLLAGWFSRKEMEEFARSIEARIKPFLPPSSAAH